MKLRYFFLLFFVLFSLSFTSCSRKGYGERRNLMILENEEHSRNKRFRSAKEINKKKKTHRKFKKRNRRRR